jgi:hypothetical protein
MEVVIFCGGIGARLREETEFRPKPMVNIGSRTSGSSNWNTNLSLQSFAMQPPLKHGESTWPFLDSDDPWFPTKLEKQVAFFFDNPEFEAHHTSFLLTGDPQSIAHWNRICNGIINQSPQHWKS